MNYSVNFTPETSTNATTQSIGIINILYICLYSIYFTFSFPTHSYIIWLIVTGAGSGVASEFFVLNLSVCNIIICLNCLLGVLHEFVPGTLILPLFLLGLFYTGHPLFQCLICVERYLAVVHPVIFLKYKPLKYRLICCTAAWMISLASCFFSLFILTSRIDYVYVLYFSSQFLLFLSIQLFCLVTVLKVLVQSAPGDRRREEENKMKRRAFYVILITTVSMTIIYVPYIVTGFLSILTKQGFGSLWLASMFCYALGSLVQPVLYLKRAVKRSPHISS